MGIFGNNSDENETTESNDATEEVAATDETSTAQETEVVTETVESEGGMITWVRPSGTEIETNDSDASIATAAANGWERK